VCDTLSVIEEESDKEAQLDDEESHSEDKGKEETRDSPCQSQTCQEPSEADVAGKGKETLQKHHLPGTMMAPPNTPAESCDECFGQDLPIATTSVSEVDKEPDVDRAPGNQTDQLGAYLGSEKLMNAIAVSETILDLAKAFGLKHLPPNIPALQLRAELASEMQSTCPVKNEPDASIKQDSDNEDEKSADLAEWTPKSIKTDPDDEVKLKDIPLLPDSIQEALGQAHAEDSEFDTDVEDWESAVGPPAVPPNSPVISAAPSNDGILTPQTSAECESQCSEKENHPPRPATIQLPEGHDDNSEPAIEGDDSGPSISQGKTLNNQLVPSEPVKALLDKIHLQGEDDKEVHKYHDVQDVDHPQPLTSKNAAPVSIRPAPKSWSAVVSGRFIPSQSSDPFPSKAPAYVSPWNNPILTGRPTSATEQLPAQPMATTSIPALEPQTLPDKTSKESNVSVRSDAPSEKMSWADEVQEETDRAGNEHAEEPKLAENSQFESEPEKIPPPPPNSPVKSWLMPEPCPRLEMLDYHVWESCRGMLMSEGNKEFLASTLAKGADSASVASHDSVAATDGTAHSTNDNASTEAVQGSSANSFADNSSTKATQGSPPSSTVDEIESTEDAGDCPRIQSMPCTTSLPLVSETDLIEFSTSSPTPEPIEAKGGCPKVQTMPCAKSLPLLEPNVLELADFPPLTQTKPVPSASTSTTPEVPAEPKKPLWSQILGRTGQAHSSEACSSGAGNPLATVKSKSEGNNDETDWPSLGSGSNKRK
jgi:hypothetical protein